MDPILTVCLVIVWVALAFWPARVAARKGHSFLGYFIFSLFFFPAALIVAYVVEDRSVVVVEDRTTPMSRHLPRRTFAVRAHACVKAVVAVCNHDRNR